MNSTFQRLDFLFPRAAAGLADWFMLWIKCRRRLAGKRDDVTQPTGPDEFLTEAI